ncbi:hypothetical protein BY458DRAFT_516808 [Sporodiniella umbellata]|nr:hypothetical protein BY458DRAFT_516808 [Sporodiniella umbellata]
MSKFTRPTFSAENDDDLERLQEEFFANQQKPSAKVFRKGEPPKMKVSSESTASTARKDPEIAMPNLEVVERPELESVEYEPVMDPNPEPHVPVTKKMLDLTSLLGQVLGEIQEKKVEKVTAPSLPALNENGKPARGQRNGFPKPVHRSEFKKRLEASRKTKPARPDAPPDVRISNNDSSLTLDNVERINQMSEKELEEAREEIMNTLSSESIAILMKGLKRESNLNSKPTEKPLDQEPVAKRAVPEEEDLFEMKRKYFPDVPLESDKLAWMDERFGKLKEQPETKSDMSEVEKVFRTVRFDLQGDICDGKLVPVHEGLHHHGDEPEKAGYTLAELFYLMRSQVPSQRGLVLTIVARILIKAKAKQTETWCNVLRVFTSKEYAAVVYLRSALDDRHLVVLVSAVRALAALVLELEEDWEQSILETARFEFMGHLTHPVVSQGSVRVERKGLNDKLTELVDRVHGNKNKSEWKDDAELAEQDLARALVKMDLLPRLRYLLAPDSELLEDNTSVELVVRILIRLAEAGEDVCDLIEEEELIDPVFSWGVVKTQWPMTEIKGNYPSLASVRLFTVLAQGSKAIAEGFVEKMTGMVALLIADPEIACEEMKQKAYSLQLETLKLLHVLTCYGYIAPILESLQEPVMDWLRTVLEKEQKMRTTRACTAIGLLEVLLHAAADPHKTVPEHAIDWHQPTAYMPAVVAVLKHNPTGPLYESALGYLGVWASYIDLFTPEQDTVHQAWKVVIQESSYFKSGYSAEGYTEHHVLRYIQFISAYASLVHSSYSELAQSASSLLISAEALMREYCSKGLFGRYALSLWLKRRPTLTMQWSIAGLELGIKSLHMGITETWLAQDLLQLCLSNQVVDEKMRPFYFQFENKDLVISKSLFEYDGRQVKTFMYPQPNDDPAHSEPLEASAFIMSPIDALYHLDRSKVAQQSKEDAVVVITKTLETTNSLLGDTVDHNLAIVSLMKIFLIGDREGRNAELQSDREVFWDDSLGNYLNQWLGRHCTKRTTLSALENAWRRSSAFIRQAQVPFYQFYQSFVAQYASVSLGHHGFARLLVYLVTQIDLIDYRHLVFSDYRDILSTLKVGVNEVPQLSNTDLEHFSKAGLILLE